MNNNCRREINIERDGCNNCNNTVNNNEGPEAVRRALQCCNGIDNFCNNISRELDIIRRSNVIGDIRELDEIVRDIRADNADLIEGLRALRFEERCEGCNNGCIDIRISGLCCCRR